jgi:hypothetical protein
MCSLLWIRRSGACSPSRERHYENNELASRLIPRGPCQPVWHRLSMPRPGRWRPLHCPGRPSAPLADLAVAALQHRPRVVPRYDLDDRDRFLDGGAGDLALALALALALGEASMLPG